MRMLHSLRHRKDFADIKPTTIKLFEYLAAKGGSGSFTYEELKGFSGLRSAGTISSALRELRSLDVISLEVLRDAGGHIQCTQYQLKD